MKRLNSIDFVRGLVMVIMALDHVRDMMHVSALTQSPTDLTTTTPLLFFTRWITHFCAPVFVFLAGISAYLSSRKHGDSAETRRFLLQRGAWLIGLEFTLLTFALWFDLKFRVFSFLVIAVIGSSFIVLALLLKLSPKVIGIIGVIIIFGHDLVPLLPLPNGSLLKTMLAPLFGPAAFPLTPSLTLVIGYPLIPWLGILLAGFAAGQFFERSEVERKSTFLKIGLAALALFAVLRFSNFYGDPSKWTVQKNSIFTFLSFLNISKYPPSLLFTLLTLGAMFLVLSCADNFKNPVSRIFTVYGKVPLFYYIVHLYLIHLLMFVMVFLQGYRWADLVFGFNFGRPKTGSGGGLGAIYLIWLSVVIGLYPLCKWYGNYKASHSENKWLRYL